MEKTEEAGETGKLYHYNEIMTVQELVDIGTFLQSEYRLVMPQNPYPYQGVLKTDETGFTVVRNLHRACL